MPVCIHKFNTKGQTIEQAVANFHEFQGIRKRKLRNEKKNSGELSTVLACPLVRYYAAILPLS